MKYCEGWCRRKWVKSEGKASSCRHHRAYTVDQEGGDNKPFEICLKPSLLDRFISFLRGTIFRDFAEYDNLGIGSRKSNTVTKNLDALRKK